MRKPSLLSGALGALAALILSTSPAAAAQAAPDQLQPTQQRWDDVRIINAANGGRLSVYNDNVSPNRTDRVTVQREEERFDWVTGWWELVPERGHDVYSIWNRGDQGRARCLTSPTNTPRAYDFVEVQPCGRNPQRWYVEAVGEGRYRISPVDSRIDEVLALEWHNNTHWTYATLRQGAFDSGDRTWLILPR